jgi:hypothetical protein
VAPRKLVKLLWQVEQSAPFVGMWPVVGFETGVTPWYAVPLWQVAQVVMPVWFIAVPVKLVVLLWQVEQSSVVGRWFVPLPTTPPVPVWQVAQPEVTVPWLYVAPRKLVKLLWQVEQSAVVAKCPLDFDTGVTPWYADPL